MNNNFSDMDRVNRIWRHPVYQEHYKKIQELESERIFCRHTPEHFLDVARLMYIYALEEHLELPKELIYASALLHDIGHPRIGDSCSTLAALLYKADKQSRNCFLCSAASECYWSDDKKNMKIEY